MPTPLIPDMAVFQRKLATLPLVTYRAGRRRSKRQRKNGASSKQQCYCSHELFSRYGLTFRRGFTCSQAARQPFRLRRASPSAVTRFGCGETLRRALRRADRGLTLDAVMGPAPSER
jgi:hypothetical protein